MVNQAFRIKIAYRSEKKKEEEEEEENTRDRSVPDGSDKKLPSDQISILVTPHSSFTESRLLAVEFYSFTLWAKSLVLFLPQKQNRGTCRARLNH